MISFSLAHKIRRTFNDSYPNHRWEFKEANEWPKDSGIDGNFRYRVSYIYKCGIPGCKAECIAWDTDGKLENMSGHLLHGINHKCPLRHDPWEHWGCCEDRA